MGNMRGRGVRTWSGDVGNMRWKGVCTWRGGEHEREGCGTLQDRVSSLIFKELV